MAGRKLIVEIVGDADSLERALKKSQRSVDTFGSRMGRTLRAGGIAAGAALGAGIAIGVKKSLDAAMEAQAVLGQTRVALKNVGASWERYGEQIETATTNLSRMAAVNDEELLGSFSILVRSTKDVNRALQLNALAADLARARNMDLNAAATLVAKVSIGQYGALRRVGIQIDKNATSTEALDELTRRYAGSAKAYGESAAGAQDRFRIAVEEFEEAVGTALLPTVTKYLGEATKWLENSENQKLVVDLLTTSVNTLAGALKFAADTVGVFQAAWDKLPDFGKDKGLLEILNSFGGGGTVTDMSKIPGWARKDVGAAALGNVTSAAESIIAALSGGRTGGAGGAAGAGTAGAGSAGTRGTGSNWVVDALNKAISVKKAQAATARAAEAAIKAQKAADKAAEDYQTRMDTRRGWLDFGIERAEATKNVKDDVRAFRALEKHLQDRIRQEGRTLELVRDLWRARQAIRDLNKKQSDKDPLAGLMQVSSKRLANMLAAGTGLGMAGRRVLGANIAGMEMRPVYVSVQLDGRELGRAVTKDQARTSRRTSRQTSGFRG